MVGGNLATCSVLSIDDSTAVGNKRPPQLWRKTMRRAFSRSVHVRPYVRFRLGKLEHVSEHWQSYPGQLVLF